MSPTPATPTDEELAAILAAVEMAWPRPVVAAPPATNDSGQSWRFSGRWWLPRKRIAASRLRP